MKRVREIVLLAGSPGAKDLIQVTRRAALDLPLTPDLTLFDVWLSHVQDLALRSERERLDVRIMTDQRSPMPTDRRQTPRLNVQMERDPVEYRGSGGILRDLADHHQPDDWLIVASGAQVIVEPFHEQISELLAPHADVVLISHDDGTPSGMLLVRCGALSSIKAVGFVDLKEQAMPAISKSHRVQVVERRLPGILPVRTLPDYIDVLKWIHRNSNHDGEVLDPYAEDWQSTFQIVEPTAHVKQGARIHDSVVLGDAEIGRNAVVVRSVIGPGAVVGEGEMVIDQLVAGRGKDAS